MDMHMMPLGDLKLLASAATVGLSLSALLWWLPRRRSHSHIRLTYLDIKGIAEPIRLAFAIGGVHFEDYRVSYEDVSRMRAQGALPYGQVPILQAGDQTIAQTSAILKWAGMQSGLYPQELQPTIDGVEECLSDIKKSFVPQWYKNALSRSPVTGKLFAGTALTEEQQNAVEEALNNVVLPEKFAQLERVLQRNGGPFFCGARMTTCDLSFYSLASGIIQGDYCEGIVPDILHDCPRLRALVDRVAGHPRVREWNASLHV